MAKKRTTKSINRWVRRNQGKHFCHCGCGEVIIIKREHSKPSVGIPKYIKGHNLQVKEEEKKSLSKQKKKSVWSKLSYKEQQRRLSQLQSFGKREKNPSWKGGVRVDESGYRQILMPDHPFARDGYVAEHRLIVERRTREQDPHNSLLVEIDGVLYLKPTAVVHHIDEVKSNNNSDNLMLLENQSAHMFIHSSPLPMHERIRRIKLGVYHSGPLDGEDEC